VELLDKPESATPDFHLCLEIDTQYGDIGWLGRSSQGENLRDYFNIPISHPTLLQNVG